MSHGADLSFVQCAARLKIDGHRSSRGFLFAHEQRRFWHRQVYASAFHRAERFNGAGQFAFQRALVVDLLAKLADTEFFLVQQFKSDRAAFRQALLSQTQTQFVNFVGRHFQRTAVIREAVRDIHLGQLGNDSPAVLIGKIAVKGAVVRAFRPQDHRHKNRNSGSACHDQRDFRVRTQAIHPLERFILRCCRCCRSHSAPLGSMWIT
ncbi:hypothetical protein D3C71_1335020 [compost metagenome]